MRYSLKGFTGLENIPRDVRVATRGFRARIWLRIKRPPLNSRRFLVNCAKESDINGSSWDEEVAPGDRGCAWSAVARLPFTSPFHSSKAGCAPGIYINAAFTSDVDRADKARSAQSGELEVFQQEDRMPAMVLGRIDTRGEVVPARYLRCVLS